MRVTVPAGLCVAIALQGCGSSSTVPPAHPSDAALERTAKAVLAAARDRDVGRFCGLLPSSVVRGIGGSAKCPAYAAEELPPAGRRPKCPAVKRDVLIVLAATIVSFASLAGLANAAPDEQQIVQDPANYVAVMLKPQVEFWRARAAGPTDLSRLETENTTAPGGGDARVLVTLTPPGQAAVRATFGVGPSKNDALAPITALDTAATRIGAFPSPKPGSRTPVAVRGAVTGLKRSGRSIAIRLDPPQSLSVARLQYFGHHPQDPLGAGLGLSERGALEFQEVYVSVGKTTRLRSGKRKLSYRSFSRLFQGRGYTAVQIDWARAPSLNAKAGIRARPVQVNLVRKW